MSVSINDSKVINMRRLDEQQVMNWCTWLENNPGRKKWSYDLFVNIAAENWIVHENNFWTDYSCMRTYLVERLELDELPELSRAFRVCSSTCTSL